MAYLAFAVVVGIMAGSVLWVLAKLSRRQIPEDYESVFAYYDRGYDDKMEGRPRFDWSTIREAKTGDGAGEVVRDVKAYNLGYDDAETGTSRRTGDIKQTGKRNEELWRELKQHLK